MKCDIGWANCRTGPQHKANKGINRHCGKVQTVRQIVTNQTDLQ